MTAVTDIIQAGAAVVVTGFPEFHAALVTALGDRALGVTLADWDHKPDIHIGQEITFPKHPDAPPVPRSADDAVPVDDDRVYVFYAGVEARNRASLCRMADVILEATGPTFARVVKAEKEVTTSGVGLQLVDGEPVVTHSR